MNAELQQRMDALEAERMRPELPDPRTEPAWADDFRCLVLILARLLDHPGQPDRPHKIANEGDRMTADDWNATHPIGAPVLAWPGARDEEPMVTCTRTPAWTLGSGAPVVSVEGYAGGIALTHVEPRPAAQGVDAPEEIAP